MKTVNIKLTSIQDVRDFVDIVSSQTIDIDLSSGRYVVDAKSIMGIFSLDLSRPLELHINTDDEKEISDVLKAISAVLVSE